MKTKLKTLTLAMGVTLPIVALADIGSASFIESPVELEALLWSTLKPLTVFFVGFYAVFIIYKVWRSNNIYVGSSTSYRDTKPKKVLDDRNERPVTKDRTYDFIKTYSSIDSHYSYIKDYYSKIQKSNASEADKNQADKLKNLAHKILDGLNELNVLGKIDGYEVADIEGVTKYFKHTDKASDKLNEIKKSLFNIIKSQTKIINETLNNITLPDAKIYEMQSEVIRLKNRGKSILDRLSLENDLVVSEDKLILSKIVNADLDELWLDLENMQGNNSSLSTNNDGLLSIYKANKDYNLGSDNSAEEIVNDIISDIKKIFNDTENGVNTDQRNELVNSLLITRRYFASR
ncbi:MAG: hypothetical protein ACTJGV_01915 [Proteus vulgaris]